MINVPDSVNVQLSDQTLKVKGPSGEVVLTLSKLVKVNVNGKHIEITSNDRALTNSTESLISSACKGAKEGYKRSFKVIYAHFPISFEVKGKDITIKNFLGEKQPRKAAIVGSTKFEAKGQAVTVSGPDKYAVGQTIANLRTAMKIKDKDGRIFQDGLYDAAGE
ncbi:MAG: 50S ribosomal protein L6 [Candidatus Bilamarchaeum sp.]|jgi:large subunit ribosomal protein L6